MSLTQAELSRLFFDALSDNERTYLERYSYLCEGVPGCIVQLNQNPDARPRSNLSNTKRVFTVTKSAHLLWSVDHQRWLTNRELLLLAAFPVVSDAPRGVQCSFHTDREQLGLPRRSRAVVTAQVGNSMNVHCVGVALVWALWAVDTALHGQPEQTSSSSSRGIAAAIAEACEW